jgi:DNA helicase HerA-like ATPase
MNTKLNSLETTIKSINVMSNIDENLLFSLERKYFDIINFKSVDYDLEPFQKVINKDTNSRILKIDSINYNGQPDIGLHLQNFSNLLAVLKNPHHRLFYIIKGTEDKTELYYGIINNSFSDTTTTHVNTNDYFNENMQAAIKSSYPGLSQHTIDSSERIDKIETPLRRYSKINAIPGIPTLRIKNSKDNYFQGIDRFIEGMQGSEYMLLTISEPVPQVMINFMIKRLNDLSSEIHSFVKLNLTDTKGSSNTIGIGTNLNVFNSKSQSVSKSTTINLDNLINLLKFFPGLVGVAGSIIGVLISSAVSISKGTSNTQTEGMSKSINLNYAKTWFQSVAVGAEVLNKKAEYAEKLCDKYIERLQSGKNLGFWDVGVYLLSDNDYVQYKGSSLLASIVSGDETHYEPIRSIELNKNAIEEYLINFANPKYKTLIYGDEKYLKLAMKNEQKILKFMKVKQKNKSLEDFKDEFFSQNDIKRKKLLEEIDNITKDESIKKEIDGLVESAWYEIKVKQTAHPLGAIMGGVSTPLNTEELSIIMNLPRKEIKGIPVVQKTEYGRNIRTFSKKQGDKIDIGELFYLGKGEKNRLLLDLNSLSSHTFITGSTGSGKSNTVFKILDKLSEKETKYLVIEPAKGEYKMVFGGRNDVRVYGTNLKFSELLKINPFKFSKDIHVLEHLDRLIEIFNATWPMYAAMPALLKEAMERVYIERGWDLEESVCLAKTDQYPSISDLVNVIPTIIKNSGYSAEVGSNYYGALVSRLKSLSNGLYRQILNENEINNDYLFNENCIIDLSRIGSMETKSLIMGIIFMRMYEYRISQAVKQNVDLKHVTVIEEAHHLMRKTSITQNDEYSNIQGKAVEMITNSIAEMRTYGEGFILVDQSPTLLDLTAIRNTNTKIILRLPYQGDKEVVGLSTNLGDAQIKELSRLETGEAVIYQNDWLQAVSGKIDYFSEDEKQPLKYEGNQVTNQRNNFTKALIKLLCSSIVTEENHAKLEVKDVEKLKNWLSGYPVNEKVKSEILEIIDLRENYPNYKNMKFKELAKIIGNFLVLEELLPSSKSIESFEIWNEEMMLKLGKKTGIQSEKIQRELLHLLICDFASRHNSKEIEKFYFNWVDKTVESL